jgi:adenylate cyclase
MHLPPVVKSRHLTNVLLAAMVATLIMLFWPPPKERIPLLSPLYQLEWLGYSALFSLRGPQPARVDPRIVIVGYDRQTEVALDAPWPPPRSRHADVITHLAADGAALIVYDVLFSDASDPDEDIALDRAIRKAGNVILSCRIDRSMSEKRKSIEAPYYDDDLDIDYEMNAAMIGFAEVDPEEDNVVRRALSVLSFQGERLPSLPAAAYLALHEKTTKDIRVLRDAVLLGDLRIPRTGYTKYDPIDRSEIPTTYINFPQGLNAFPYKRFDQVCLNEFAPGTFKGKIVFVGITGPQLTKAQGESFVTAYTQLKPEQAEGVMDRTVPGVVLQAQIFNAFLQRDFMYPVKDWVLWLMVFVFAFLATWTARHFMNWRGPVFLVLIALAYMAAVLALFTYALYLQPWPVPIACTLATAGGIAWVERGRLRKKWSGYVSPAVLQVILQQESGLGAQRYEASVIFGDVRNFTGFSEKHPPETVVRLLNKHLERLTRIIYQQEGTIDKFLGDGILVVFGAPLPQEDAAVRAVRASWIMREIALQPIIDDDGTSYTLATGFGITTGPLVAGHVGSSQRHEFTIIGDTVNLASRLQGVTGKPDVIIDTRTYELVKDYVDVESLGEVTLKGKAQPVPCFLVTAWKEPAEAPEVALPATV